MLNVQSVSEFGTQVREQRKKQQLTQEELAAMSGVGIRFVRELEQGKPSCHFEKALIVAHMLGLQMVILKDRGDVR